MPGLTTIIIGLLFIFGAPITAPAEETPFDILIKKTSSLFSPMRGDILTGDEESVTLNIGSNNGVMAGMRLTVFREGDHFYHPVTREDLGKIEKRVGTIAVIAVSGNSARCRVIKGEAKSGDFARISALKKRLLFYQDEAVDYYLGDAYYRELTKTGSFDIIDAPIEEMTEERLFDLAESKKADVVLRISSEIKAGRKYLKQGLFWNDGALLYEGTAEINADYIEGLRFGSEFLADLEDEPLISYDLPYTGELLAAADVTGDGKTEIIISSGSDIYLYEYDHELRLLTRTGPGINGSIIYLDTFDINGDGKAELFISAIADDRFSVNSHIYTFEGLRPFSLWKTKGFIRVMDGRILHQGFSPGEGYSGPVKAIDYNGNFAIGDDFDLAAGLDIYDVVIFTAMDGNRYYLGLDKSASLELLNTAGASVWRSDEDMGGFTREYSNEHFGSIMYMKDRMLKRGNEVVVIKRNLVTEKLRRFGFKSSDLLLYQYSGLKVKESDLLADIPGSLLDYSIYGNSIALIHQPLLSFRVGNIVRGEQLQKTVFRIYSLKGK